MFTLPLKCSRHHASRHFLNFFHFYLHNNPLKWIQFVTLYAWGRGFPGGSRWSRIYLQCRRPGFNPWVGKICWRRAWQPTPVRDERGNPLQYSCRQNFMDRGAWWAYSPWVAKSRTQLSDWTTTTMCEGSEVQRTNLSKAIQKLHGRSQIWSWSRVLTPSQSTVCQTCLTIKIYWGICIHSLKYSWFNCAIC